MDTKIIRPVLEPHRITSPYGMRVLNGTQAMHDGIDYVGAGDYGGPADRTVFAIADGVVISDGVCYRLGK